MPTYLSPGVYVEEIPSDVKPIAGVGTSTAGFIGFFLDTIQIPKPNPAYDPTVKSVPPAAPPPGPPVLKGEFVGKDAAGIYTIKDGAGKEIKSEAATPVQADPGLKNKDEIEYQLTDGKLTGITRARPVPPSPPADGNKPFVLEPFAAAPVGNVVLCTNFTEFKQSFGDFSTDPGHRNLAHGVYGFFHNGGARCWVAREKLPENIDSILLKFEGLDEIAIVVAPGITDAAVRDKIVTHCQTTGDRFAILDTPLEVGTGEIPDQKLLTSENRTYIPPDSNYAAIYFPWIQVLDPATKFQKPTEDGRQYVPPSGHIAGIYARVDQERGVHKAPANEVVRGALDLRYYISKKHQDGLNPKGVNCIRDMNGAIRVWGARTIGGDRNAEWKYVNIRRTFLYLRESIDEGTQWVVFEPNDQMLWGKIVRNVSAFLTNVWRDGALFGSTPGEAFYVKCDEETNPASTRDLGQVITEIGVALTRPAEFVIFHISQWAGPEKK